MIDTRTLALVVGSLSLAFGIWAATGAPSEVGLAAGALGFVTGLVALVSHGNREPVEETSEPSEATSAASSSQRSPGETESTASSEGNAHDAAGPTGSSQATPHATSKAGFFDRDPSPGEPGGPVQNGPVGETGQSGMASGGESSTLGEMSSGESNDSSDGDTTTGGAAAITPLTDPLTGLFSEDYLAVALEGRLASARRHLRPVALALLQVTQGLPDAGARPADPEVVAKAISETVRDSDIACRLGDGTFGMILEDTPENGAVWTVERIRRNLVSTSGHHTLWAGVACYPAHAFDAGELMTQVREALANAKEWNQDRIEVAIAE